MTPGTVAIVTLGCAKNQVDSEIIGARLAEAGWRWIEDPAVADITVVNSCAFIDDAKEESVDTTLTLVEQLGPGRVVLAGCLAQRYADELAREMPDLAAVFGNRHPDRVPELFERIARRDRMAPLVWLPQAPRELIAGTRHRLLSSVGSAYLKVAEGCNHACSFCAIPTIRGRLRVRSRGAILTEFRTLRAAGIHEFNLVAQDLAAWRDEPAGGEAGGPGILSLVETLLAEPGDFRLRLLYLYPDRFPRRLADLSHEDPRLLPYFDLSFQHADPAVLRAMGRPGDDETYLELIADLRRRNPDVVLRSSFIVGFPGETRAAFERLLAFVRRAELEWVGVFTWSAEESTPAAAIRRGRVAKREAVRRRELLFETQAPIMERRIGRFIGREISALVEEVVPGTGSAFCRGWMHAAEVDGSLLVTGCDAVSAGDLVTVRLTRAEGPDLHGERIG